MTLSSSIPDPEDTPRGMLAKHLRIIRQRAGFTTQAPLAKRLGVSADLISKIETGKHAPPQDVFLAWLDVCQLTEEARTYVTDIWVIARAKRGGFREFFEKYAGAEVKAAFLRMWGVLVIPGPLQTLDYAYAMFRKGGLDEDEATYQAGLRVDRQNKVDGPDAAHVTVLIYELALHRLVGTPEIMVAQLQRLLDLSSKRNVVLQVVPDDGSYFKGLDGEFAIASGPAISDTVVTVTVKDHVTDDPGEAGDVIALFEAIRGYARNVAESRALLTEALELWMSKVQQ
ncbi:MAG TPA: helix-turn-helix transcriptional regulator [Trebonia sp.]|jgi:transcriptional regulator with XRE-family HTH domain|nr:helix-turn-helix transcriptional regulator [Trebonia sp.]